MKLECVAVAAVTGAALIGGAAQAGDISPRLDRAAVTVTVKWYDSRRAVVAACKRLGAWSVLPTEQVMRHPAPGCAEVRHDAPTCTVHVLRPERLDDARSATLGHEVLHCLWGSYHD